MPQTRSLTALAKRCEPEPSYHPLNYMKYFPNDMTQQDTLFGDDFEYDFSKWPLILVETQTCYNKCSRCDFKIETCNHYTANYICKW